MNVMDATEEEETVNKESCDWFRLAGGSEFEAVGHI